MAYIINLKTNSDSRGSLTVIEKVLPFEIKRVFYIYGVAGPHITRGGHRHKETKQALVSVAGSCIVDTDNGREKKSFELASPETCLILEAEDWHIMRDFEGGCVLLVLASQCYDSDDYIKEGY